MSEKPTIQEALSARRHGRLCHEREIERLRNRIKAMDAAKEEGRDIDNELMRLRGVPRQIVTGIRADALVTEAQIRTAIDDAFKLGQKMK